VRILLKIDLLTDFFFTITHSIQADNKADAMPILTLLRMLLNVVALLRQLLKDSISLALFPSML